MLKQRTLDLWMMILQVSLEIALFYFSFIFAYFIRFYSGLLSTPKGIPSFHLYLEIFPVAVLVMVLIFKSMGLYDKRSFGVGLRSIQVFKAITVAMFVLMSITFIYRDVTFSRLLLIVAWLLCLILILLGRVLMHNFEKSICKKLGLKRKILLIGKGDQAEKIIQNIQRSSRDLYQVIGILTQETEAYDAGHQGNPAVMLGDLSQVSEVLAREKPHEVILAIPNLEQKKIVDIILACEREMVRFRMIPDIFEILTTQVEVENFYGVILLGLKQFPLEKALNRFWKRFMDIVAASLGLIFCLPIFTILAVLIKKDSSGPVFYRQERIGEDGRKFSMIKFRTMVIDAEEKSGPVWASENDPRRTQIGRILRRFNLDELPQLWNVLKGEMSLVGPRPERPYFVDEFKDQVPRYMSRHKIKSGVTGWAQVNGLRGNTSIAKRVKFDLYYLENWSILFDLRIICMTFLARENAY